MAGPPAREFAAWRYGRRFSLIYYRALAQITVGAITAGGAFALGGGLLLGVSSVALTGYLSVAISTYASLGLSRAVVRLPRDPDRSLELTLWQLRFLRVVREPGQSTWQLDTQRESVIEGPSVVHALALALPHMNRWGIDRDVQDAAIHHIRDRKGSEGYLESLRERSLETFWSFSKAERFAAEMAANEEVERAAVEGELRLLEAAWREADAVAGIADSLLIPVPIEQRLWELKTRRDTLM